MRDAAGSSVPPQNTGEGHSGIDCKTDLPMMSRVESFVLVDPTTACKDESVRKLTLIYCPWSLQIPVNDGIGWFRVQIIRA